MGKKMKRNGRREEGEKADQRITESFWLGKASKVIESKKRRGEKKEGGEEEDKEGQVGEGNAVLTQSPC